MAATWRDATHLVMTTPMRTVKLLCCLSRCKYVVSLQWLFECFSKNTFVDETPYILGDAEFEKSFGCNIEKALQSPNRGTVLKVSKLSNTEIKCFYDLFLSGTKNMRFVIVIIILFFFSG